MEFLSLNEIEGLSKFCYVLTILWGLRVWWRVFLVRHEHQRIMTLFWVQSVAIPLYCLFNILYILNLGYHATLGYFGWTVINVLFMATDGMMSETLSRNVVRYRAIEQQCQALGIQPEQAILVVADQAPPLPTSQR